jgi:A/G-specific adenine glycosylase
MQGAILAWYARSKRDLPWRRTRDPYAIWLSEVMLQQTRVETVVPYYARFLRAYPTVRELADAPLDDVLAQWSGLGYYRRARMLHAGAQHVARAMRGAFPDTVEGLREIPGIGPYTAGAVASIAFGRGAALVDGNVARVLSRLFAVEADVRGGAGLARIWRIAEELVGAPTAARDPGGWNQALMELGATTCAPREPRCATCPARAACEARARGIERDLPRLKRKARPVGEARVALVATRGACVLLAQRRTDGRFGGMWEPPSVEGDDPSALGALAGVTRGALVEAGKVTHVLSHRRLEVTVVTALVPPASRLGFAEAARGAPREGVLGGDYTRLEMMDVDGLARAALTKLARKVLAIAKIA